ncbi:MAG: DNA-binding transcriptional regulator [Opitutae bacterium]|nr:DNA-binding transcriptional regulator [Opitutae bacterium]
MSPAKRVAVVIRTRFEENQAILRGIAQFEQRHGPWLAFVDDQAVSVQEPDWLFRQEWDGVICGPTSAAIAQQCRRRRIPLVDLRDNPEAFPGVPKVRPDNVAIGHVGAEHLLEKGYAHFGFCGFANTSWSQERRHGFVEAVTLGGQQCDVLETDYPGKQAPDWNSAQEAVIVDWLRRLPRPVAVMACNDLRAIQVINACQQAGIVVPEEVAVLGANNESSRCELCHPSLSSVAVNANRIGYRAAELLHAAMKGEAAKESGELVEPLKVVARRSTDVLAIGDPKVARALHYIREHACRGLTVDEVVREVHVSRSVLERKFRNYLRRSPQAEIRYAQVQRAKELLAETDASIAEIAEATSIEYPEYLCVLFKRITGETPRRYREKARSWKGDAAQS